MTKQEVSFANSHGLKHPGDAKTITGQGIFVVSLRHENSGYGRLTRTLVRFDEDRPEEVLEAWKEMTWASGFSFIGRLTKEVI